MNLYALPAVVSIALIVTTMAAAQHPFAKPDPKVEANVARVEKILSATVDTKDIPNDLPLTEFLKALEAKLPKDAKLTLCVDAEAFGKDAAKIQATRIKPSRAVGISLQTILRQAMAKAGDLEYGIQPDGVVVTTPQRAVVTMGYDVREIVEFLPRLPRDSVVVPDTGPSRKPLAGSAGLMEMITDVMNLQPWEAIRIVNDSRLIVDMCPRRHEEVGELLEALRRLADTSVYMNARLYEVDRAFFTKHVVPLLAKNKGENELPAAVPIDGNLLKTVVAQMLLLESDDMKIWPGQKAVFLSFQNMFRFNPGRASDDRTAGIGFEGLTFDVRPQVSPDRRFLRLQITQTTNQLIGIGKAKILDVTTGKDVEVESPNLRKSTRSGATQVADGAPVLIPVDYRPTGKAGNGKVWVVVARPVIWIEAEAAERRQGGAKFVPKSVWETKVEPPEKEPPRLPLNDDVDQILQAVITDLLTDSDLEFSRKFYGTEKDKIVTLVDGDKIGWPKGFEAKMHGYKLVQPDPFGNQRRILGIRIDKFDLNQIKREHPIEVSLFNAGGSANGAVIGGCLVYYSPKRMGNRWVVECLGLLDP